jgi:hypothetical protein
MCFQDVRPAVVGIYEGHKYIFCIAGHFVSLAFKVYGLDRGGYISNGGLPVLRIMVGNSLKVPSVFFSQFCFCFCSSTC